MACQLSDQEICSLALVYFKHPSFTPGVTSVESALAKLAPWVISNNKHVMVTDNKETLLSADIKFNIHQPQTVLYFDGDRTMIPDFLTRTHPISWRLLQRCDDKNQHQMRSDTY